MAVIRIKAIKAADQVLVCLTDGEKTMADIVFELDFRPSIVYNAVIHHVSVGNINVERPGKRGRYMLTDQGLITANKVGDAVQLRVTAGTKTQSVLNAIIAGCATYAQIGATLDLSRIEVASAIQVLKRNNRIKRTDPGGESGRGGKTIARFAPCQ